MSILSDGLERVQSLYNKSKDLAGNPLIAAAGGAVAGSVIAGTVVSAVASRKKSSSSSRSKSSSKKPTSYRRKVSRRSKSYKYARTAGKGKDTSTRRIRMTKNGQPYVILKSGKARFISKKSARASRKRKGGRY